MIRDVVKIDEDLCTGCGDCVPGCHEGALQIIDGKARLISDLLCDGLGACLGTCPTGALTIEKREAEPYDEIKVMNLMVEKGHNTVVAHMKHLKDHGETTFLKQAVGFLQENEDRLDLDVSAIISEVHNGGGSCGVKHKSEPMQHSGSSCPGSQTKSFTPAGFTVASKDENEDYSALSQWPVQLHLINPAAGYFQGADVVLAADCVAFAMGNFHQKFLAGKKLCIACPKLDSGLDTYLNKIKSLINDSNINTLTVIIMEVPCCSGLTKLAQIAIEQSTRKIPLKVIRISIQGKVLSEDWI